MSKIIYFDCFSGCAGDMILGALLDAGLDFKALEEGLYGLGVSGFRVTAEKVKRAAIAATKFDVIIEEQARHHRGLTEILGIINGSRLPDGVKDKSAAVFRRLGEVEARVHGIALEDVHFHELGAVDTIVDIVGTVYALELLDIERLYASALPAGTGYISSAHGRLPSPAPATLALLSEARTPLVSAAASGAPSGELVTPTGAALLTSLAEFRLPNMSVEEVGYGAGTKEFENWPNVLRVWLGEETGTGDSGELTLLETNIDDMNPQIFGYLMEKLLGEKALDVWFTPIQMKKNRPAVMLSVLGPASAEARLTDIIMRETSTLGIRSRRVSRHIAYRETIEFESSLGRARAKVKKIGAELLNVSPEYDDCSRIAGEQNLPLREVSRIIETEARRYLTDTGRS